MADTPAVPVVPVKSGIFTTEFILHAAGSIIGTLLAANIIPNGGSVGEVVGGALAITSITHWGYIRTKLKTIAIDAAVAAWAAAVKDLQDADKEAGSST